MSECLHCSNRFSPTANETEFCCSGCRYTYSLIKDLDLDRFYLLKGDKTVEPVGDRAFAAFDPTWLENATADLEPGAPVTCHIEGLSCVGCVWLIEKLYADTVPGGRIELRIADASARLRGNDHPADLIEFAKKAQKFGYTIQSPSAHQGEKSESSRLLARLGVTAGLAMNCMGFSLPRYLGMPSDFEFARLFDQIAWISATLALLVGGSWFIKRAWRALRLRRLHIDLPIAIGLLAAYGGSIYGWSSGQDSLIYFDFVAIFSTLMLAGRYLQTHVLERNRSKLRADSPEPSPVLRIGSDQKIPPDSLKSGDQFQLEPGQVLPVRATLLSPITEASLEWIDGEPEPRLFRKGDLLPSGSRPLSSKVEFEADEAYSESILAGLLTARSPDERSPLSDRLLAGYLAIVLLLAIAGLAVGYAQGGGVYGLQIAISILVISCPCALGVSLPLATELANNLIRKQGVHVTAQGFWSRLNHIRQWVMDKTGTLTSDLPQLKDSSWIDAATTSELEILAALARHSSHPFSRSLYQSCTRRLGHASDVKLNDWQEIPACGPKGTAPDGSIWSLQAPQSATAGAACELFRDGQALTRFDFTESLRDGAAGSIAQAQRQGLGIQILSGDKQTALSPFRDQLGLDESQTLGGLSPADKAQWLKLSPLPSLFLGDGINDALAIESATVAGCPATGQGWTKAKVDFYYTSPGLGFIPDLLATAKLHRRACIWAIGFAMLYNSAAIAICFTGAMTPLLAAILMPLSSLASLAIVSQPFRQHTSKDTRNFYVEPQPAANKLQVDERPRPKNVAEGGSRV